MQPPSTGNFDVENAPAELVKVYAAALSAAVAEGLDPADAERCAIRQIQLAGWYRVDGTWSQMTPDVRSKVNIRKAHLQPGGKYLICDVDVFYPNAVKGVDAGFDVKDIERMIDNTNRSIANGAQRPGLTKVHPNIASKGLGTFIPSHGSPINFRMSPRGEGWVRCDIVDVEPEIIEEWKKNRITGLSAGLAEDGGQLNARFGHVAMLGGESQALTSLPQTYVYADSTQLCFSADSGAFSNGAAMKDRKGFAKAMKDCYAAYAAAYASEDMGEPNYQAKMTEARGMYAAARAQFGSDFAADFEASGTTPAPDTAELHPQEIVNKSVFSAEDVATFSALKTELSSLRQLVQQQAADNSTILKAKAKGEFQAMLDGLRREGHAFDADSAIAMFESAAGNVAALQNLEKFLRATPKNPSLAKIGQVFDASAANPPAAGNPQQIMELQSELAAGTGATFSAGILELSGLVPKGTSASMK